MVDALVPEWPAPVRVRALQTRRGGGVSAGPFATFNLGTHVGDRPDDVARNRARLREALPASPQWLQQVHGRTVVRLPGDGAPVPADAAWTDRTGTVCAVMTADCLPVLLCSDDGDAVAAAHAGWRGLAAGVLEATVDAMPAPPRRLMAWLGPAIGPAAFEVGPEVRAAFVDADPDAASCFRSGAGDRWLADLFALARRRLLAAGVRAVFGGGHCTFSDPAQWFSFRRDGRCGRMASLIWIDGD